VLAPIGFIGQQLPRVPQKIQGRHVPLAVLPVPILRVSCREKSRLRSLELFQSRRRRASWPRQ
jgi:hypothetical protein